MNTNGSPLAPIDKWQRMQAIVNQHSAVSVPDITRQFKKLVISRLLAENMLVFLLQYIGLTLTTLTPQSAPLWFATGTACAFIFMRGSSILPGIWLGSFIAYYAAHSGLYVAGISASVYTGQAFLLLWLSYQFISPTLIFVQRKQWLAFLLCASMLTAATSFLLELCCYTSLQHPLTPWQLWLQWWLANLNGILIISFAMVALDFYFPQMEALKSLPKWLMGFFYGLLCIIIGALIFSSTPLLIMLFIWCLLLLTLAISACFGWCGVLAATFLSGILLSLAASLNAPLFTTDFSMQTLIFLQGILLVTSILGLYVAVGIGQKIGGTFDKHFKACT